MTASRPAAVCVFCGSRPGARPAYAAAAGALGRLIARRGLAVTYGGARIGLMGVVADAALSEGGVVRGVIPRALAEREVAHGGLTELHLVETMHERKARMAELSGAFVALPGGAGTLEELAEVWTWAQLGLHAKPIGLLNTDGYFDGLLAFVRTMVTEGFVTPADAERLVARSEPEALLDALERAHPPAAPAVISNEQV